MSNSLENRPVAARGKYHLNIAENVASNYNKVGVHGSKQLVVKLENECSSLTNEACKLKNDTELLAEQLTESNELIGKLETELDSLNKLVSRLACDNIKLLGQVTPRIRYTDKIIKLESETNYLHDCLTWHQRHNHNVELQLLSILLDIDTFKSSEVNVKEFLKRKSEPLSTSTTDSLVNSCSSLLEMSHIEDTNVKASVLDQLVDENKSSCSKSTSEDTFVRVLETSIELFHAIFTDYSFNNDSNQY